MPNLFHVHVLFFRKIFLKDSDKQDLESIMVREYSTMSSENQGEKLAIFVGKYQSDSRFIHDLYDSPQGKKGHWGKVAAQHKEKDVFSQGSCVFNLVMIMNICQGSCKINLVRIMNFRSDRPGFEPLFILFV